MIKIFSTCSFFLFLLSAAVCYAANGKPCVTSKADINKQPCKTSEKLISEKLLKVKPVNDVKALEKSTNSGQNSSPANTFESLITPFLKAVSPHFYDHIIRREQKYISPRAAGVTS